MCLYIYIYTYIRICMPASIHKNVIRRLLASVKDEREARIQYYLDHTEETPDLEADDPETEADRISQNEASKIDAWSTEEMLALRGRVLKWVADLLRSPLSEDDKQWMLDVVGTEGWDKLLTPPPQRMSDDKSDHVEQVNLAIVARCIAEAFPEAHWTKDVRPKLCRAWNVPPRISDFIQRKSQYGVYIVKGELDCFSCFAHKVCAGGMLEVLQKCRIQCREISIGDVMLLKAKNNNMN